MSSSSITYLTSPLEQFEVSSLLHIQAPLFNYITLSLTNFGLYSLVAIVLAIIVHTLSINNGRIVPNRWTVLIEAIYDTILGIIRANLGAKQEKYIPLIYSIFTYILVSNLIGNVTYSFATTSALIVGLGISISLWLGVTILSIHLHGVKFLTFFVPAGAPTPILFLLVPIEIISYISRALSLGIRLSSNIISGHALITILAGFIYAGFTSSYFIALFTIIPFTMFLSIVVLEVAVAFIQAYVWIVLTCGYIRDAIYLHLLYTL